MSKYPSIPEYSGSNVTFGLFFVYKSSAARVASWRGWEPHHIMRSLTGSLLGAAVAAVLLPAGSAVGSALFFVPPPPHAAIVPSKAVMAKTVRERFHFNIFNPPI
ncbi:hypothetical protein D3C74_452000 [compost metagenome]